VARTYAMEAAKLGWPWIEYNPMKRVTEILVFEKTRRNMFTKEFALSTKHIENSTKPIQDQSIETPNKVPHVQNQVAIVSRVGKAVQEGEGNNGEGSGKDGGGKDGGAPKSATKKQRTGSKTPKAEKGYDEMDTCELMKKSKVLKDKFVKLWSTQETIQAILKYL